MCKLLCCSALVFAFILQAEIADFKESTKYSLNNELNTMISNNKHRLTVEEFFTITDPQTTYERLKDILQKTDQFVDFLNLHKLTEQEDDPLSQIKATFYISLIMTGMEAKKFAFELLAYNSKLFSKLQQGNQIPADTSSTIAGTINNVANRINTRNAWHRYVRESAISKELDDLTATDIEITNAIKKCNTCVENFNKALEPLTQKTTITKKEFDSLKDLKNAAEAFITTVLLNLEISADDDFDAKWKKAADETNSRVDELKDIAPYINEESIPLIAMDVDISGSERQMLILAKKAKQQLISELKTTLKSFLNCLNKIINLLDINSDLFNTKEEAIQNFQTLYSDVGFVTYVLITHQHLTEHFDVNELITARKTIYNFLNNKCSNEQQEQLFKAKVDLHLTLPAELTETNNLATKNAIAYLNTHPYSTNSDRRANSLISSWWQQDA